MSNNLEPTPTQPSDLPTGRWAHLHKYERRYLKQAMEAYDAIAQVTDDIPRIANRYQFSIDDVQRAKDYGTLAEIMQQLSTSQFRQP